MSLVHLLPCHQIVSLGLPLNFSVLLLDNLTAVFTLDWPGLAACRAGVLLGPAPGLHQAAPGTVASQTVVT